MTGVLFRPWKSLWWPTNSTNSSFRGIIRGNEIDSLHPISDDLITDFSFRGFWVRYFMQSWFPFVPTPQSPALCHICLLCPFQSYLVSGGPSGSLSHPPPPGPMAFLGLQCCWGEWNACIEGPREHRDFSLSELPPGVELQTICLKLPCLGTFVVEASVLSVWRPSIDA